MTAANNAIAFKPDDAPSHEVYSWHATDWRKALRNVRRLQARIVKAVRAYEGPPLRPSVGVRDA